jgi:hypothetical protein
VHLAEFLPAAYSNLTLKGGEEMKWIQLSLAKEGGEKMKRIQLSLSLLLFFGVVGYASIAASAQPQVKGVKPGVIAAMPLNKEATFCHLRFPAIVTKTLGTDKPRLRPATSGDIIDYYGPCDHDPLGKEEIESQRSLASERAREQD